MLMIVNYGINNKEIGRMNSGLLFSYLDFLHNTFITSPGVKLSLRKMK